MLLTFIQDESTKALIFYTGLYLVIGFLIIKWIRYNKRKSEERNEYPSLDIRLYGALLILLIGLAATINELIKRF